MYILINIVLKKAVHISLLWTGLFVLVATHAAHFVYYLLKNEIG